MGLLCWLFGHTWFWYMIRGDHGEPGADACRRCLAKRDNYTYPCRCLGRPTPPFPCNCEFNGFVGP